MIRIKPDGIKEWKTATKTKPIKAKPLKSILNDSSILEKFLVTTLEGNERLDATNVICLGEGGDAWQQTQKTLLKKYVVTSIDDNGWLDCTPKPDNEVNCFKVIYTPDVGGLGGLYNKGPDFYVIGLWGEPSDEGPIQSGVYGDYILQSKDNSVDVWIVKEKFFNNTYTIK